MAPNSERAKFVAKHWPEEFDRFDEDNASTWFSQKKNLTFSHWNTALITRSVESTEQESRLKYLILEREAELSACQYCAKKEVGKEFGKLLTEVSLVEWKDSMGAWVMEACITLAPRIIVLWKRVTLRQRAKHVHAKGKEDESQYNGSDTDGDLPASPKVACKEAQALNTTAEPPAPKKTRLLEPEEDNISFEANNDEYAKPSKRRTPSPSTASLMQPRVLPSNFLFVQRAIIVIMDEKASDPAPLWVPVAISAIIQDKFMELSNEDVRCEHVDWEKFKLVLRRTHRTFDLSIGRSVRLRYDVSYGEHQYIDTADEFTTALGVLDWEANMAESTGPLMMRIEPRGRN